MALNFPSSPSLNQTYTVGTKTWVWNGSAWDVQLQTAADSASLVAAWATANSAFAQANAAYNAANNVTGSLDTLARTTANSAYAKANTAYTLANDSFILANTSISTLMQRVDSLSSQTNIVFNYANASYLQANTATTTSQAAYDKANSSTTLAQSAFNYANTLVIPSLTGYAVNTIVNFAWTGANSAYNQANSAWNTANTALSQANSASLLSSKDYTINNLTSNTSVTINDSKKIFLSDTSNNIVLSIPAGNTVSDGFNFKVTRLNDGDVTLECPYPNHSFRLRVKFNVLSLNYNSIFNESISLHQNITLNGEYKTPRFSLSNLGEDQTTYEFISVSDTEYAIVR